MAKKLRLNGTVESDNVAWIYDWFGISVISPSKVINFLDEADGDDVELTINSGGGDVDSGAEIYTVLRDYKGNSTVKVVFAASAASVIAMGGKKVLMSPAGQLMIHNAATGVWGNKNDMGGAAAMLQSVDESIANAYVDKTGMSREDLLALMNETTWMDAVKAKELGFVDEIMFSESTPQVTNSVANGQVLPAEVINKMRNFLTNSGGVTSKAATLGNSPGEETIIPLNNGAFDLSKLPSANYLAGLSSNMPTTLVDSGVKQPVVAVNTNKGVSPKSGDTFEELKNQIDQMKGEKKPMDLNQLKTEHPDLYNQLVQAGVTNERNRVNELNALAKAPGAAAHVAEGIKNGSTKVEVMEAIINASMNQITDEANKRQQDVQNSGVNKVPVETVVTPEDQKKVDAVKDQEEVDEVVAEMNRLRGVK